MAIAFLLVPDLAGKAAHGDVPVGGGHLVYGGKIARVHQRQSPGRQRYRPLGDVLPLKAPLGILDGFGEIEHRRPGHELTSPPLSFILFRVPPPVAAVDLPAGVALRRFRLPEDGWAGKRRRPCHVVRPASQDASIDAGAFVFEYRREAGGAGSAQVPGMVNHAVNTGRDGSGELGPSLCSRRPC